MRQARESVQLSEAIAKEILKDTARKCAAVSPAFFRPLTVGSVISGVSLHVAQQGWESIGKAAACDARFL